MKLLAGGNNFWGKCALSLGAALGIMHPAQGHALPHNPPHAPELHKPHLADSLGIPIRDDGEVMLKPEILMNTLLQQYGGLIMVHPPRAFTDLDFLNKHMADLSQEGVTTWFIDSIMVDHKDIFKSFSRGKDVTLELKEVLREAFSNDQGGAELSERVEVYYDVMARARDNGMTIYPVGINLKIFNNEKDMGLYQGGLIRQKLTKNSSKSLVTVSSSTQMAMMRDILGWPNINCHPTDKKGNFVMLGDQPREYTMWLEQSLHGWALPEHVRRSMLLESDRVRLKLKNRS